MEHVAAAPEETQMTDVVIVSAARTAVGKFGGSLAKIAAPELGATVIRAVLALLRWQSWPW